MSEIHETARVHHRAAIHTGVSIGARTKVWQFANIIRNSVIGEDCSIASCAIIDGCRLANRVIVSHGAFLGPGIEISDDVFIGPHVCFCNDYWPRVSKEGWFDLEELLPPDGKVVTRVLAGASIGAGVILMPGVVIGSAAMIAAGAVVTGDVPDGQLYRRDGTYQPIKYEPERRRHV